jgi:hypothetical protein
VLMSAVITLHEAPLHNKFTLEAPSIGGTS